MYFDKFNRTRQFGSYSYGVAYVQAIRSRCLDFGQLGGRQEFVARSCRLVVVGAAVHFGVAVRRAEYGAAAAAVLRSHAQPFAAETAADAQLLLLGLLRGRRGRLLVGLSRRGERRLLSPRVVEVPESEQPRVLHLRDLLDPPLPPLAADF